jgi:hypothetical protein
MSRVEAITTNLVQRVNTGGAQRAVCYPTTYLWNTETQLRGPLNHFPWYSSNLGFIDWRKGPMKGIFHDGPTIEPLLEM